MKGVALTLSHPLHCFPRGHHRRLRLSNQTCNLVSPFDRICDSAAHPGCCLAAAVPLHDSRCHIASLLQSYSMVRIRRPAGFAISHAAAAGARPPTVRTPAQPYTAGRPTPQWRMKNTFARPSSWTCNPAPCCPCGCDPVPCFVSADRPICYQPPCRLAAAHPYRFAISRSCSMNKSFSLAGLAILPPVSLSGMICNPHPCCRSRSSASGSKNPRTALYCRQADSAAALLPSVQPDNLAARLSVWQIFIRLFVS